MAKILLSDRAPSGEAVTFSLAGTELFQLSGSESFTTEDGVAIRAAESHPWLKVERDPESVVGGSYFEQVAPADDALSAQNSVAFDVDKIRETEEAKREDLGQPVAIQAGLKQDKPVVTGGVAETLAADKNDEEPKAPSRPAKESK